MQKSLRKQIAEQTLKIIENKKYQTISAEIRHIDDILANCLTNSQLWLNETPLSDKVYRNFEASPYMEVRNETTLAAARRVLAETPDARMLALNFASAKNPGGGFLSGAEAQEESLARASALYASQTQFFDAFYEYHRKQISTCLYTHRMIYSPKVPVFRDDNGNLLEQPYLLSMLTSPAVNAGVVRQREGAQAVASIGEVMKTRMAYLFQEAAERGYTHLILGAWGCGVFQQDPNEVARWFCEVLDEPRFKYAFERIVWAVYSRRDRNFAAFEEVFA